MSTFKRAKVVMLPIGKGTYTNYEDKIYLDRLGKLFITGECESNKPFIEQHLYIISDNKIEEGDWYLDTFSNKPLQAKEDLLSNGRRKIIATTDESLTKTNIKVFKDLKSHQLPQPSQSFIEKYIEQYNKGNIITDIMVEYETKAYEQLVGSSLLYEELQLSYKEQLKINPKDNTITIKSIKNSWNRDELEKLFNSFASHVHSGPYPGRLTDKQWIEKNL